MKEAEKWFDTIMFSMEQQRNRTEIEHRGYGIFMDSYDNFLGDNACFERALEKNEEAVQNCLKSLYISCLPNIFYGIAWNSYELAKEKGELHNILQSKWENAFTISIVLADFLYDSHVKNFLNARRMKFLFCPFFI